MSEALTIGRALDNTIVLAHPHVSGRHARLTLVDKEVRRFRIEDLNSTNGVYVNGARVSEAAFGPGDEVMVANIKLVPSLYLPYFVDMEVEAAPRGTPPADQPQEASPASSKREQAAAPRRAARPSGLWAVLGAVLGIGVVAGGLYLLEQRYGPQGGFVIQPVGAAQTVGYVAVAWALFAATVSLVGGLRRLGYERRQQAMGLEVWRTRLEAAARQRDERRREEGAWSGLRKFEIARKTQEGGGICSFHLVPHDHKPLPAFKPGQYLTFQLPIPGQPRPVVRCYSLSDSPFKPGYYRVTIKKLPPPRNQPDAPPGLSSSFFHERLREGDIVDVRAPAGHFYLDLDEDTPVVLIGGGVGITPVLSMLNAIADSGATRETWFFYGVRNGREHIMAEHLRTLARRHPNVRLQVCYSNPEPDEVQGEHYHHAERVSVELFKRLLPSNNYAFYICGPPPMMDSITADLEEWGVPREQIHFEAFGPASAKRVTHAEGSAKPADGAFEVRFERSGKTFTWSPQAGSLLDLAEANGLNLDFGCRAGNCGTCTVAVRDGKVEYLNEPGAEPEAGSCLTCIARPAGNLVLDA